MQTKTLTQLSALALGVAGVLAIGHAHASGFQLRENSVQNLGRANAGSAVAQDDAAVVSNNPAAMTNFDTNTVQTDLTVIDLTAEFNGDGTTAVGTPLTGGDGGDPGDPTAVPAIAAIFPLSGALEGLTVGASISAPFGLTTEYDRDWVGRYNAIKSEVTVIDLTLSASIKLHDRFSVGAGLIYERAEVTLTNAIDFGTSICTSVNPANCFNPAFPFQPQGADGTVDVTGSDTNVGWLIGAQWQPTDRLSIGYSHRSEIDHEIDGTIDFTVPPAVLAALGPGAVVFADGPGGAPLTLPSIDTLSIQYDINDSFRMMADIQQTDWHSLQAVDIRRADGTPVGQEAFAWKDTTFYSLGAEFDLNEAFTLRAGIAQDESPTNDLTRSPRLPDNDRKLYSIGLGWNASDKWQVDAAFQRITIDDPSIDSESSSSSVLVGEYSGDANLFGISAQYRF